MATDPPGCAALLLLEKTQTRIEQTAWRATGPFEPAEAALLVLVAVPLVSAALWRILKLRSGWWFRWAAPALVGVAGILWWHLPKRYAYHSNDTVLLILAALTVGVLAWQARRPHREE